MRKAASFHSFSVIIHSLKCNATSCLNLNIMVLFVGIAYVLYIPYCFSLYLLQDIRNSETKAYYFPATSITIKTKIDEWV